jgi:cytidine deaminase
VSDSPDRGASLDPHRDFIAAAEQALACAYAPYSSLRVGAALRTVDGAIVTGRNVENVAFPIGFCAERNAIASARGLCRGVGPVRS